MRARVVGHHSTGYTKSATNCRQHAGEDPALSVLDWFLRFVIFLEYFLRAHPSRRWCATLVIIRPISHHCPVVIGGIHLEIDGTYER